MLIQIGIVLQKVTDFTTGNLTKSLISISFPTIIAFTFQTLNDLIDMMWIGNLSSEAVAGVTIFTTIFWIIILLNNIIGTSSIAMISQSYGAKEFDVTIKVIEQTITFKFLVSLIAALFLVLFMEPLFRTFTKDPIVLEEAYNYGFSRIYFLPIMFSTFSVNTSLICIGDSRRQMYLMIAAAFINFILDPIMIFKTIPFVNLPGLGWGVYGAAMATNISFLVAFIWGFRILFNGTSGIKISWKGLIKLNKEIDKKLWSVGLPSGLENLTRSLGQLFSLSIISSYGTAAIAVMGISTRIMGVVIIPLYGLMRGASSLVGHNLGADKTDRAEKTALLSALLGLGFMFISGSLAMAFAEPLMKLFSNDKQVIQYGITMIYILFPGYLSVAVMLGFASVFPGSGYNKPMLISGIFSKWIIQLPLLYLVTKIFKLPFELVWWSFVIAEFFEMIIIYIYFKNNRWKNYRV